jgi:hypothetical protein
MEKRNSSIPKMVQYQKATSGFSHENTLRSDAKLLIRKQLKKRGKSGDSRCPTF